MNRSEIMAQILNNIGTKVRVECTLVKDLVKEEARDFRASPKRYIRIRTEMAWNQTQFQFEKASKKFEYVNKSTKVVRAGLELSGAIMRTRGVAITLGLIAAKTIYVTSRVSMAFKTVKAAEIVFQTAETYKATKDLIRDIRCLDYKGMLDSSERIFLCVGNIIDDAITLTLLTLKVAGLPQVAILVQVGMPISFALLSVSMYRKIRTIGEKIRFDSEIKNQILPLFKGHINEKTFSKVGGSSLERDIAHVVKKEMKKAGIIDFNMETWQKAVLAKIKHEDNIPVTDHAEMLQNICDKVEAKLKVAGKWNHLFLYEEKSHTSLIRTLHDYLNDRLFLKESKKQAIFYNLLERKYFKNLLVGKDAEEMRAKYMSCVNAYLKERGEIGKGNKEALAWLDKFVNDEALDLDEPMMKLIQKGIEETNFQIHRTQRIVGRQMGTTAVKKMEEIRIMLSDKIDAEQDLTQEEVNVIHKSFRVIRGLNRRSIMTKFAGLISNAMTVTALGMIYSGSASIASPILLAVSAVIDLGILIFENHFFNTGLKFPNMNGKYSEKQTSMERAFEFIKRELSKNTPIDVKIMHAELKALYKKIKRSIQDEKMALYHTLTDSTKVQKSVKRYDRAVTKLHKTETKVRSYFHIWPWNHASAA